MKKAAEINALTATQPNMGNGTAAAAASYPATGVSAAATTQAPAVNADSGKTGKDKSEKEILESLANIQSDFLAVIHNAEVQLRYFDYYSDEVICQLLHPSRSIETIKSYDPTELKSLIALWKKSYTMIHKSFIACYNEIWPFKNLETCYDQLSNCKLFTQLIRDDDECQKYFRGQLSETSFKKEQQHYNTIYTDIISFFDNNIQAIDCLIENNQKNYWKYVKAAFNWDSGKPEPYSITKTSEFQKKLANIMTTLDTRVRKETRPEMASLVKRTLTKIAELDQQNAALMFERLKLKGSNKLLPRESSQKYFYQLYETVEQLFAIGKDYDTEVRDIDAGLKLKDDLEKLKAYQLEQKTKRDDYKKMLASNKEKKATQRKIVVKKIKATEDFGALKIAQGVCKKLENCTPDALGVVSDVLRNAGNITEKSIDALLPSIGFSIENVGDQGYKFKIGKFSATYHHKHAADAQAGILHIDFITELRRIFWALGINQKLVETLAKSLPHKKNALKAQDAKSGAAAKANAAFGKPIVRMHDAKAAKVAKSSQQAAVDAETAASHDTLPSNQKKKKKKKK